MEEALAYQELIKEHNYTHEQCAEVLGLDRSKDKFNQAFRVARKSFGGSC